METTLTARPTDACFLTNEERDALLATFERDGFCVLPEKLPEDLHARLLEVIDAIAEEDRMHQPDSLSVKRQNCVDLHSVFRELLLYPPALQLCHDLLGPMFHLNQSNFISRHREPGEAKFGAGFIGWHADGPRPGLFPMVKGAMGLHYLKFGYFLTDLTHETGGSLEVVRGSHLRPERDGLAADAFAIERYAADHVKLHCEAGTVVAFHQALWHAAFPNQSDVVRKNLYYSYCPTWMRPVDRDFPTEAALEGLTAEERWLLGEPRPAMRWWLPGREDLQRMQRFARMAD